VRKTPPFEDFNFRFVFAILAELVSGMILKMSVRIDSFLRLWKRREIFLLD